jgi:predicted RNA binding protein YcfA (HicA-like mRNA interferase family)
MPKWSPCKRSDFIRGLRQLGFEGVFSGAKHQFMVLGEHRLTLPSNSEYSVPQLRQMLREAEAMIGREITLEERARLV